MNYGFDLAIFEEYGIKVSVNLDPITHCHSLVTGSSGSGKSKTVLYLIGSLLCSNPDSVLYICDFKKSDDFSFLNRYKHYYGGIDCYKGIMEYYTQFDNARQSGYDGSYYVLIADEYPAFITYLESQDKANKTKRANDILSAVAEILMMGRGLGFGLWIVTQRADSSWFSSGSRDNFMSLLSLGRLSREQGLMIFSGEDIPTRIYKTGQGLLLADGQALREVVFPLITDIRDWECHIVSILYKK